MTSVVAVLRKLKGRSFGELRERAAQSLAAELEFRGVAGARGEPSDNAFRAKLNESVIGGSSGAALRAHVRTRATPSFFAGVRDRSAARALRSEEWSVERAHLISAADRIIQGRYDVLGHEGLSYGDPVDWHFDPVAGKHAPKMHWSRIPYLDAARVGDHKVIWEINRHQHFVVLGRAWQVSDDPRYAECFVMQVASWMDANPPKRGINWASSLEVSYRAISWLWAIELFREAPELTDSLLLRMLKFLDVHARHLERYLSTYFSPNTHLTGEALGLLYLGTMLPELRSARRWRDLGWRILADQLPRQVHDDGVYFEQATYYHRYTADIYLHAVALARLNGGGVSGEMLERLARAMAHLAALTRPDGTVPIIGDDDGGRLVALEQRRPMDVRSALTTGAVILDRPELAVVAGAATEELLWLTGPAGVDKVKAAIASGRSPSYTSRLYAEGGYAIMRDGWHKDALHAVVDCGPLGALNCGHAHSDALSVELSAGGCSFVVDPGTYSYTSSPEARDKFRHSASHNTLTINGESSSVPAGPFSWRDRTDARVNAWWSGELTDRLVASHAGYDRLEIGVSHQREVWFIRGAYWVIVDRVDSRVKSDATAHFHFALGATVEQSTEHGAVLRVPCRAGWRRLFFSAGGDVQPILWGEDWVSPSYGNRSRAPYARVVSQGEGSRVIISVIGPQGEFAGVSVREEAAERGRLLIVNRQNTCDQILVGVGGEARADGLVLRGDGALIRRASEGGAVGGMALYGAGAEITVGAVTMRGRGAAESVRDASGWRVVGEGEIEEVSR